MLFFGNRSTCNLLWSNYIAFADASLLLGNISQPKTVTDLLDCHDCLHGDCYFDQVHFPGEYKSYYYDTALRNYKFILNLTSSPGGENVIPPTYGWCHTGWWLHPHRPSNFFTNCTYFFQKFKIF